MSLPSIRTDEHDTDNALSKGGALRVIVLDTNPSVWQPDTTQSDTPPTWSFDELLHAVSTLIRSHLLTDVRNGCTVIASHVGVTQILYEHCGATPFSLENIGDVHRRLVTGLKELQNEAADSDRGTVRLSALSGALARALCYANSHLEAIDSSIGSARILVVHRSAIVQKQYVSLMNCVFAAQKLTVPIDAFLLRDKDAAYLLQACNLSEGIYLRPSPTETIVQCLLFAFGGATDAMVGIAQSHVDNRASCFCHNRMIDVGYICSVCLSIFCDVQPVCSTCGIKFHVPT